MKTRILFIVLITMILASPFLVSCNTTKELIVDNKELIKDVLLEIIDRIIDMIGGIPNASVSKSVMRFSPDYHKVTVDIMDSNGGLLKTVEFDILKEYMKRMNE